MRKMVIVYVVSHHPIAFQSCLQQYEPHILTEYNTFAPLG